MPSSTTASQAELKAFKVPLEWRDGCSSLVIPLNICRKQSLYMPWKCEHERHTYEKCQYDDYVRRMKEATRLKLAAEEAAANA
ncbi:NADH-ubiquinone oxidoreductase B18 subunit-domain-containing protein [Mycena rebaudengoi]|nr:NADH-ubiquinone oxidoreductase B18 subunit-domain-containing protein [Mycena rebaudengoi]